MERSDWKIDMSRQFIRSSLPTWIIGPGHILFSRHTGGEVLYFSLALQNPLAQQKTRPLLQYFCDCGKDKGTLFPLKQSRKVFSN